MSAIKTVRVRVVGLIFLLPSNTVSTANDDEPKDNRWIIYILDEEGTYASEIRFALSDGWNVSLDDSLDFEPRESH